MNISIVILSVFCAGGVVAYAREWLRLRKLLKRGKLRTGVVTNLNEIDSGETVTHFIVAYEYPGERGELVSDEQDINHRAFFDTLSVGDRIDVLCTSDTSYPMSEVTKDLRIAMAVLIALIVFWCVMTLVLA